MSVATWEHGSEVFYSQYFSTTIRGKKKEFLSFFEISGGYVCGRVPGEVPHVGEVYSKQFIIRESVCHPICVLFVHHSQSSGHGIV